MFKYIILLFIVTINSYACEITLQIRSNSKAYNNLKLVVNNISYKPVNTQGFFQLNLDEGNYDVEIYNGINLLFAETIEIDCVNKNYEIDLDNTYENLDELVIETDSKAASLQKSPYMVQVLEMQDKYAAAGDVGNVLNQSTGIKIRSSGGLGSATTINLGGLQGKAVRLFKDGVPLEMFGHGYDISALSANMLDRIEIYKGSMPGYLVSDALGGGINLISKKLNKNAVDFSYELSSFNTHRFTSNVFIKNPKQNYYLGFNTLINTSKNNYKILAPFTSQQTGEKYYNEVKRFHDGTKSIFAELYLGVEHVKWADDFRLSFIISDFFKELQNDAEMGKVFGESTSHEHNYSSLLQYKKNFVNNKLKINVTANYSTFYSSLIDTTTNRYNWYGDKILTNQIQGEINRGGSDQKLNYDMFSNRSFVSYKILNNHEIEFGNLFFYQERIGSDPFGAISPQFGVDVLKTPAIYKKSIVSLSLVSNYLSNSLETVVGIKDYRGVTKGFTTDKYSFAWDVQKNNSHVGYMAGIKWLKNQFLLKSSYEYATRMPDEIEVFGDGVLIKENLDLLPEKSHNISLFGQYSFSKVKNKSLVSAHLFYRNSNNSIYLQPDIPYNRYTNFHQVAIKGIEIEMQHSFGKQLLFGINATYQDIRRVNERKEFAMYEKARMANIPYLFGNLFIHYRKDNFFLTDDEFGFKAHVNYLHRFYLSFIPKNQEPGLFDKTTQVNTNLIIPNDNRLAQIYSEASIYYTFYNKRITGSLTVQNITNENLYDNFNVQKPGRSIHLKWIYSIM